jgi:SAM-dependent methyltransferase
VNEASRQREYWDAAAETAVFTHPLDAALLRRHVGAGRILDFGCGYGRLLAELQAHGFRDLVGADASEAMVARARRIVPGVPLHVAGELPIPEPDGSFACVLLFAVFTCMPRDEDQRALASEVSRLLAPGGIVHVSDFLMRSDARSRERYRIGAGRFGKPGVFEIEGGLVVRHHTSEWVRELWEPFETLAFERFEATSMLGNPASGFRFVGRKPANAGAPPGGAGLPPHETGL